MTSFLCGIMIKRTNQHKKIMTVGQLKMQKQFLEDEKYKLDTHLELK